MKNYWLDYKDMTLVKKNGLKFRGKFQEADPVNKQVRIYDWKPSPWNISGYEHHPEDYEDMCSGWDGDY